MPTPGQAPDQTITDAAWNACAVASIAHRQALDHVDRERAVLLYVVDTALGHGLTPADVHAATGLDADYLEQLRRAG